MFGNTFNVETMDALDWAVAGGGTLTCLLFLWRCIVGLNLLEPGAFWSADGRALALALAVWSVLLAADWVWPVRSTIYVVNNDHDKLDVTAGDENICLPYKSYSVFVWRSAKPGEVVVHNIRTGELSRYHIGAGIWLINGAHAKVAADFMVNTGSWEGATTDAVALAGQQVMHVPVRGGRSIHFYSTLPLDRIFAFGGDLVARHLPGPCAVGR